MKTFDYKKAAGHLIQMIAPTVRFMEMLADCYIFVFSNRLKRLSGCVGVFILVTTMPECVSVEVRMQTHSDFMKNKNFYSSHF